MSQPSHRYCIDTCSLVHAYQRSYPPDILPMLWDEKLDSLIQAGQLSSPFDVFAKLERKHDDLHACTKDRAEMFLEIDHFQDELSTIVGRFPRLVDTRKGKSGADPMVIALALSGEPLLTVVTEEGYGSAKNPKIPFVCDQFGIRHINVIQLLRDQKWAFS
jgi:hypothetical protein